MCGKILVSIAVSLYIGSIISGGIHIAREVNHKNVLNHGTTPTFKRAHLHEYMFLYSNEETSKIIIKHDRWIETNFTSSQVDVFNGTCVISFKNNYVSSNDIYIGEKFEIDYVIIAVVICDTDIDYAKQYIHEMTTGKYKKAISVRQDNIICASVALSIIVLCLPLALCIHHIYDK